MTPLNDWLPEEREEPLTALLQRAYSASAAVPPERQVQIIARVQERLLKTASETPLDHAMPGQLREAIDTSPRTAISPASGSPRRRGRLMRLSTLLAAALVLGALLASFLILLTGHRAALIGNASGQTLFALSDENDGTVYALRPGDGATYWHYSSGRKLTGGQVASNSVLYVGSSDGHVYALRKSDGSLLWKKQLINFGAASPDFVDATAVYISSSSLFAALSVKDGHVLWLAQHCGPSECIGGFVAVADGTTYVFLTALLCGLHVSASCNLASGLYAYRGSDGKVLWHHPELQFDGRSFAVIGGKFYFPAEKAGKIYELRASDGHILHTFTFQKDQPLDMIAANGVLYVESAGHDVYAIGASDDRTLWHKSFDHLLLGMSTVEDGAIYFVENIAGVDSVSIAGTPTTNTTSSSAASTSITALNTSDGSLRWSWRPSQSIAAGPLVILNARAYFDVGHDVYALNASNGKQVWKITLGTRVNSLIVG